MIDFRTIVGLLSIVSAAVFLFALHNDGPLALRAPGGKAAACIRAESTCLPSKVLDYFEVGTSDFNTMVQSGVVDMKSDGKVRHGVSIDAMQLYLDRLPHPPEAPGAVIFNAAVVGFTPHPVTTTVYYIEPADLLSYNLPDYLKGCNRVGAPHDLQIKDLSERNLLHLLKTKEVPMWTLGELLEMHNGCRTKMLKVDVEGLDATLLMSYVDFLWRHPECWADELDYELQWMPVPHQKALLRALATVGYFTDDIDGDRGLNMYLKYDPLYDARLLFAGRAAAMRAGVHGQPAAGGSQGRAQGGVEGARTSAVELTLDTDLLNGYLDSTVGKDATRMDAYRAAAVAGMGLHSEKCPWK